MYCTRCGEPLEENAELCPVCKTPVTKESPTEEATEQNAAFTAPEAPAPAPAPANKKYSGKAIAGFVLSLVGLLIAAIPCGILGLVFSSISFKETESEKKGKGLAIAGLVISIVDIVAGILFIM